MLIRKLYKFEAAHVVRDCNSERCKKSVHGHGYKVEVFFKSNKLTDYGMVIDFGDMKGNVGNLIDMFDHSWHYWNKESEEFKEFIHQTNQRWVELPFSPTAENYAIFFLKYIRTMIFDNKDAECVAVRVHETDTGYAEASVEDLELHNYYDINYYQNDDSDIKFSNGTYES